MTLRLVPKPPPADPLVEWADRHAYDITIEACGWTTSRDRSPEEVASALRRIAAELHRQARYLDPKSDDAALEHIRHVVRRILAGQ